MERKGLCWYPSYHACVTTMHGGFLEPLLTLIMPWYRSNQRHSSIRINIPAFFCSFIFSRAAVRWTVFCCVLLYAVTQSQMSALHLSQEFSCGLSKKKKKTLLRDVVCIWSVVGAFARHHLSATSKMRFAQAVVVIAPAHESHKADVMENEK